MESSKQLDEVVESEVGEDRSRQRDAMRVWNRKSVRIGVVKGTQ
ncbi:hypothetical protein BSG1_06784 [Bacillus sp. SG-1]|nr:hypothetical protein BSG1_06784 [Bacillus sp. SG-1]